MTEIFKKTFIVVTVLAVCLDCVAQVQLQTKKFRLSQFTQTSTMVVLTGNEMDDALLRDGVKKSWNISPYEFCDMKTFDKEKSDTTKFFLVVSESTKKNEDGDGFMCINLFQGSKKETLFRISSIPFRSTDGADGREFTFLPLLLRTLQNDVEAIMSKEFNIGGMVKSRTKNKHWDGIVTVSDDDLAVRPSPSSIAAYNSFDIFLVPAEEIDSDVQTASSGKIVSYVVAPVEETPNGMCYKMLIDTSTGELFFIGKHKLTAKNGRGFLKSDLDKILDHKM